MLHSSNKQTTASSRLKEIKLQQSSFKVPHVSVHALADPDKPFLKGSEGLRLWPLTMALNRRRPRISLSFVPATPERNFDCSTQLQSNIIAKLEGSKSTPSLAGWKMVVAPSPFARARPGQLGSPKPPATFFD